MRNVSLKAHRVNKAVVDLWAALYHAPVVMRAPVMILAVTTDENNFVGPECRVKVRAYPKGTPFGA